MYSRCATQLQLLEFWDKLDETGFILQPFKIRPRPMFYIGNIWHISQVIQHAQWGQKSEPLSCSSSSFGPNCMNAGSFCSSSKSKLGTSFIFVRGLIYLMQISIYCKSSKSEPLSCPALNSPWIAMVRTSFCRKFNLNCNHPASAWPGTIFLSVSAV